MAELAPLKATGEVLQHETEAKAVFAEIDTDGSGALEPGELGRKLSDYGLGGIYLTQANRTRTSVLTSPAGSADVLTSRGHRVQATSRSSSSRFGWTPTWTG